ncbi:hypothetical protein LXA43DRAFT_1045251 [Ganoderma leucocontextum]|nr:hypothetical protein LXA43DRAFT_1045251 [Ganoderma leucocontextum]
MTDPVAHAGPSNWASLLHLPEDIQQFKILQLPQDVQLSILLAFNIRELVICKRLCRSLANLINNNIAIRYKLDLARSGRIDGTRSVAVIDRLAALRKHRARFHAGDHPLKRAPLPPFGFLPTRSGMVVVDDSVPLWRPATTFSGFGELKIAHSVQRLGLDGHRSGSCAVDLAQDLLIFSRRFSTLDPLQVVTECCIYSLSEGQPHPLASRSHIPSNLDFQHLINAQICDDIQVLGDSLAWNVHNGEKREMWVFNWKTGVAVCHFTAIPWWHCRLVSQSHVVVFAVMSLHIYSIDRDRPPAPATHDTPLCTLDLPAWSKNILNAHYSSINSYIQFPPAPGPDDAPLYRHDPDLTVLTIYLEFRVNTPRRVVQLDQYAIFVPVSTLKARVEASSTSWWSRRPRIFSWNEWGPTGARIVHFEFPCTLSPMGCSVAVTQKTWTGGTAALKVFVFDVHPRARQDPRRLQDARGLVYATDTLFETPAFAKRIRTTFPFEFTFRDIPLGLDELSASVVLTEDGLVLVTPAA